MKKLYIFLLGLVMVFAVFGSVFADTNTDESSAISSPHCNHNHVKDIEDHKSISDFQRSSFTCCDNMKLKSRSYSEYYDCGCHGGFTASGEAFICRYEVFKKYKSSFCLNCGTQHDPVYVGTYEVHSHPECDR